MIRFFFFKFDMFTEKLNENLEVICLFTSAKKCVTILFHRLHSRSMNEKVSSFCDNYSNHCMKSTLIARRQISRDCARGEQCTYSIALECDLACFEENYLEIASFSSNPSKYLCYLGLCFWKCVTLARDQCVMPLLIQCAYVCTLRTFKAMVTLQKQPVAD